MEYQVDVEFDDSYGDVVAHRAYFSALTKYGGRGSGHPKGTSSVIVSEQHVSDLKKDFVRAGIKVIRCARL